MNTCKGNEKSFVCRIALAIGVSFGALVGAADQARMPLSAVSPDGRNEIRVTCDDALCYSVWRDGRQLLSPSKIALHVRGKEFLPKPETPEPFQLSGNEKTPFYKKSSVSLAANGCRVKLGGGYALELVARDDGVAYRFATDFAEDEVIVESESAPVAFPKGEISVWRGCPTQYADADGSLSGLSGFEPVYSNLTSCAAGLAKENLVVLPLVAEYEDGTCLSITESDQRDYPGWLLRGAGRACELEGWFSTEPIEDRCCGHYHIKGVSRHPYIARTAGRRTYPWRLFQIAASAVKLCEGDAVYALAEPCKVADTSWIKPGVAQWDWWHRRVLFGVDFVSGLNTPTYLHYVDFAAEHGVPYVVIDARWSKDYKILHSIPEIDLPKIVKHAGERGVGIVLWLPWVALIDCAEESCKAYAALGIKGFKVDGLCRNDRYLTRFLEETARVAAKHRLVLNYHGTSKPSGLSRTYPNVLTYEGVHGLEYTKWEGQWMPKCDFPQCDLTDFFCRMTAGPMDYTPGAMRNCAAEEYYTSFTMPVAQGTRAHQMALFTLFESPLQMLCDSPSVYRKELECFRFISKVPTVWDETVGLAGKIGEQAVVARRKGDVWYVAALTDWTPRTLTVDLAFLKDGEWAAEIFADGPNAETIGVDYARKERTVRAGEKLTVSLAPGGGWTARLARK